MKDVCCQVLERIERDRVRVRWWNIAFKDPFPMGSSRGPADEIITIKDPENWSRYADVRSIKTGA